DGVEGTQLGRVSPINTHQHDVVIGDNFGGQEERNLREKVYPVTAGYSPDDAASSPLMPSLYDFQNAPRAHNTDKSQSIIHHGQPDDSQPWTTPEIKGIRPAAMAGHTNKMRYYNDWWFWETSGAILSMLCMISVIIMLRQVNNTPLHQWNFYFQPNAVISAFVVVSKTAMLLAVAESLSQLKWLYFFKGTHKLKDLEAFEEASRGPWGAFVFLWRLKKWNPLALVGCVVMIAALAMDPFAQQIVSFPVRYERDANATASIAVTNAYQLVVYRKTTSSGEIYDVNMVGAFYSGLFNKSAPLDFLCPSANCTWDPFYTLGLSAECKDVSRSTEIQPNKCSEDDSSANDDERCTRFTLTTPRNISVSAVAYKKPLEFNSTRFSISTISPSASDWSRSGVVTQENNTIALVALAYLPYDELQDRATATKMYKTLTNVTECKIRWCAKRYTNIAVLNGALNSFTVEDIPFASVSYAPLEYSIRGTLNPNAHSSFKDNIFHIDTRKTTALQDLFLTSLNLNSTLGGDDNWSNALTRLFYESTNTTGVIQNIAASLTDNLRHNENNTTAKGHVIKPVAYIKAHWVWISLPVMLVVISMGFLGYTIWATTHARAPLWKSGLLPLLFHTLEGWKREELEAETKPLINDAAEEMHARLEKNENGELRFRKSELL
ncbi:uncharacterized protein K452DRAFT_337265, partial [Aplosporella prunicola CBS 121167]